MLDTAGDYLCDFIFLISPFFFKGDGKCDCDFSPLARVSEIASREDSVGGYPDRPFAYRIASTLAKWAEAGVCPIQSMPMNGVHQHTSSESLQPYTAVSIIR